METIRDLRRKAGMTQQDLAVRLGVSVTSVSSWEQGKYDPNARQFRHMARIFGVGCDDFVLPSDERDRFRGPTVDE